MSHYVFLYICSKEYSIQLSSVVGLNLLWGHRDCPSCKFLAGGGSGDMGAVWNSNSSLLREISSQNTIITHPQLGLNEGMPHPFAKVQNLLIHPPFPPLHPNTFLQVPKDPTGQKTLKFQHKSDNNPTAHCLLSYIHTLFKSQSPPHPNIHP